VFPLWEVGGWGLGMMVLMVVLMMVVVMMVMVMIVVLVLVLVLGLLGKRANERKNACEKDISTTWGCAFGEIAVVAVRGIFWCAVGATCGLIYGGLLPDACVPRCGPRQRRGSAWHASSVLHGSGLRAVCPME